MQCRVKRVTLTGGEPFAHPDLVQIVHRLRIQGLAVGLCTNATLITDQQLDAFSGLGDVHFNVSLDGFRPHTHGKFRGNTESFHTTIATVRELGRRGLLQGLLATPNNLAEAEEYREICEFAQANGAEYVLMNPLSSMGRGVRAKGKLEASEQRMQQIYDLTHPFAGPDLEVVHIRFPNTTRPLAPCEAGNIIYVFVRGEVTVCPYLVFAAKTPLSKHDPGEFIAGNIFADEDFAARLDDYRFHERYQVGSNPTCKDCSLETSCGKGCPAAIISSGKRIGDVDEEVCPVTSSLRLTSG